MKKLVSFLLSVIALGTAMATDYYVDSAMGNDLNPGTSPDKAWKSFSANTTNAPFKFKGGDRLLIKAGTEYKNQQLVILECNATPETPFIIDRYGDGAKPIINLGTNASPLDGKKTTLYLKNSKGVEVRNLEIQNYVGTPTTVSGQQKYGAYIYANNMGEVKHIVLDGIDFKHIKGDLDKSDEKAGSGVFWYCEGATPTYFNGLEIANCEFYNVDRVGITGNNAAGRKTTWYNNINVHIHRNNMRNIGGQAITIKACDGAVCEYNRVDSCGVRERGVAIWCYKADNTVIQYNIVSNALGATDAQGFDSDWNCTNSIFQYNMSVHNEGGFMLICNPGDSSPADDVTHTWNAGLKGTTVRYNLSVDDGFRERPGTTKAYFSPTFHITGDTRWSAIYGNTLVMLPKTNDKIDRNFVTFMDWGKKCPSDTYFYNNLFYAADGVVGYFDKHAQGGKIKSSKNTVFSNNAYVGEFSSLPTSKDEMFPNGTGVSDEKILKYDQAAQRLQLSDDVFENPAAIEEFSITGLSYEEALEKATAFKLLPQSVLVESGKQNFYEFLFNGIDGIQLDYYELTGFTGYEPVPTLDYLNNRFSPMAGKQLDFFGNNADDKQAMSIGFHNAAAASGLSLIGKKQVKLFPTYVTDYVIVPALWGEAHVVTASGALIKTISGTGEDVKVDASILTPGIYFIRTQQGTGKFIKE